MMGTLVVKRLRDITDALLEELFHGVAIEPILQPNADNNLVPSTTNTNGGTRLDVSARSFWIMSQKAFFDVRLFDANASRYQFRILEQRFAVNEREKKRLCNRRILEVERASFTPFTFAMHDAMGIKYKSFVSKLSELLATRRDSPKSTVTSWVKMKISFALIRSMLICLYGLCLIKISIISISDIDLQENPTKNQRQY